MSKKVIPEEKITVLIDYHIIEETTLDLEIRVLAKQKESRELKKEKREKTGRQRERENMEATRKTA